MLITILFSLGLIIVKIEYRRQPNWKIIWTRIWWVRLVLTVDNNCWRRWCPFWDSKNKDLSKTKRLKLNHCLALNASSIRFFGPNFSGLVWSPFHLFDWWVGSSCYSVSFYVAVITGPSPHHLHAKMGFSKNLEEYLSMTEPTFCTHYWLVGAGFYSFLFIANSKHFLPRCPHPQLRAAA